MKIKNAFFFLGVFIILLLSIPVMQILLQTKKSYAQEISTPIPAAVCGSQPTDIMLVIDRSGSMNDKIGTSLQTKLQAAVAAANQFIDTIAANTNNHIGLVTFSDSATLNAGLSNNFSSVKSAVSKITAGGNTCIQCGAQTANQEIVNNGRANVKKITLLLTDGIANAISGHNGQVATTSAEQSAIDMIKNGYQTSATAFYAIGLGKDVNQSFLQQIAALTGAKYYFSPTSEDLSNIYQQISQIEGKGSISGFVFNDINNNGFDDISDTGLSQWNVNLSVGLPANQPISNASTDGSGGYSFTGLCDGIYYVSQTTQSGWTQTMPIDPDYYKVTILNGNAVPEKDFGNTKRVCGTVCGNDAGCGGASNSCNACVNGVCAVAPTATPSPVTTQLQLSVSLHGIGNGGDNVNPAASLSNKTPVHTTRNVHVSVYDTGNQQIADQVGGVTYSSASGSFTGTVDLGSGIATGQYYIKILTDYHLRRLVSGEQTLTAGTINTIPPVNLTAGDADNDNQLSLLDYNLLRDCYSVLRPAIACTDAQKTATDFNDDGNVDGNDYNLFIRELSVQNGE